MEGPCLGDSSRSFGGLRGEWGVFSFFMVDHSTFYMNSKMIASYVFFDMFAYEVYRCFFKPSVVPAKSSYLSGHLS